VLQLAEGAGHLAAGRLELDLEVAGLGQAHGQVARDRRQLDVPLPRRQQVDRDRPGRPG
jgi:hypothetical protein